MRHHGSESDSDHEEIEETTMGIFGRRRVAAPARAAERCRRCGSTDVAVGYVDRVTVTVTRRCEGCGHEWREQFIDLTSVGPVLNGHR